MGAAGSVIPATREAALADGYTEAEIDAYIASKSPIEGTSMPATASNTTSTSVSNTDKSIHNPEGEQQEEHYKEIEVVDTSEKDRPDNTIVIDGNGVDSIDPESGTNPSVAKEVHFGIVDEVSMDLELRHEDRSSAAKLELGWKETGRLVKRLSEHELENKALNFERGRPRRIPTMDRIDMVENAHEKLLEHEEETRAAAEEERLRNPPCQRCGATLLAAPYFTLEGRHYIKVLSSRLQNGIPVVSYTILRGKGAGCSFSPHADNDSAGGEVTKGLKWFLGHARHDCSKAPKEPVSDRISGRSGEVHNSRSNGGGGGGGGRIAITIASGAVVIAEPLLHHTPYDVQDGLATPAKPILQHRSDSSTSCTTCDTDSGTSNGNAENTEGKTEVDSGASCSSEDPGKSFDANLCGGVKHGAAIRRQQTPGLLLFKQYSDDNNDDEDDGEEEDDEKEERGVEIEAAKK